MRLLIVFIMFFLIGCGATYDDISHELLEKTVPEIEKDPRSFTNVDPEIGLYISRFEAVYDIYIGDSIVAGFTEDLGYGTRDIYVGMCYRYRNGLLEIVIRRDTWESYSDSSREQLIFHELGHCIFGAKHNNRILENGCPASIMRDCVFSEQEIENCYDKYRGYYYDELEQSL